jgi:hypothetical protein
MTPAEFQQEPGSWRLPPTKFQQEPGSCEEAVR